MKKILILPFLQMPSGHHQAAEAISAYLKEINDTVEIKKIDIFHYTSRLAERFSTNLYLKALKLSPSFYSWLYRQNACRSYKAGKRYKFYEYVFLRNMKKLIEEEKPDFIFCTHCLPSYLLNVLKGKKSLSIPVINIYTDYFINTVWGIEHIDYHLAPSQAMKNFLELHGVPEKRIFVTGIPVHPKITKKNFSLSHLTSPPFQVLVSGGSLGVGQIENLFNHHQFSGRIKYFVLSGNNKDLFKKIEQAQNPLLVPLSYIPSREGMNELYESMDVMLTKPGGITVSECLRKGIPLFLLESLPGPEEQNKKYLLDENLAKKIKYCQIEHDLLLYLENDKEREKYHESLSLHTDQMEKIELVLNKIMK